MEVQAAVRQPAACMQDPCGPADGKVPRNPAPGNACPALSTLEERCLELADDTDGVEHLGGVALGELIVRGVHEVGGETFPDADSPSAGEARSGRSVRRSRGAAPSGP